MTTVMEMFLNVFTAASEITFDSRWDNGQGYFPAAINGDYAPEIKPGTVVATMSDDGRRIVLIGTEFGNVVVHQRHYDASIVVCNAPAGMTRLLGLDPGILTKEGFRVIFGEGTELDNIGFRTGAFFRGLNR